jgi:hypothetical protein
MARSLFITYARLFHEADTIIQEDDALMGICLQDAIKDPQIPNQNCHIDEMRETGCYVRICFHQEDSLRGALGAVYEGGALARGKGAVSLEVPV